MYLALFTVTSVVNATPAVPVPRRAIVNSFSDGFVWAQAQYDQLSVVGPYARAFNLLFTDADLYVPPVVSQPVIAPTASA